MLLSLRKNGLTSLFKEVRAWRWLNICCCMVVALCFWQKACDLTIQPQSPTFVADPRPSPSFGTGKRGHCERGLFTGGISKTLENGRILLCFPQSGGSLESLSSLESLETGLFWKDAFSKRPLFPNPTLKSQIFGRFSVFFWPFSTVFGELACFHASFSRACHLCWVTPLPLPFATPFRRFLPSKNALLCRFWLKTAKVDSKHSCTRVRGPPVALQVSRYMCRSRFPQNPGVFQV